MKRFLPVLALVLGLTLLFSMTAHSERGHFIVKEREQVKFDVKTNGRVIADNIEFKNMSQYFLSDHFRGTNKRCKPVDAQKFGPRTGISVPFGSPSDCSLSCTTIKSEYWPSGAYTIPIVFHVIYKKDGTGNIPDSRIINQVAVLNEDYRAMAGTLGANGYDVKIQFELVGITRHQSNRYFADRNENYKKSYGWDPTQYMNVYTNTASGYLGYAYYPQDSAGEWWDGITLNYEACGGRDEGSAPYNQGRTLVHEAGHYLGLMHTFEGGCASGYCAGDRIEDTNPESSPYYYCGSRTTCGSPDPTTNYMDYSEDLCMWQFTAEQANRAVCSLTNYRIGLYY
jgi:hypothetical protein